MARKTPPFMATAIEKFNTFLKTSLSCDIWTASFWDFRIDGLGNITFHTHGEDK